MNMETDIFDLQAELCQLLSNAARLRVIHTLQEGPKFVNEIAAALGLSQSTVSRHLSALRASGLVTANRQGQEVQYDITVPRLIDVCELVRGVLMDLEQQQLELFNRIYSEEEEP